MALLEKIEINKLLCFEKRCVGFLTVGQAEETYRQYIIENNR